MAAMQGRHHRILLQQSRKTSTPQRLSEFFLVLPWHSRKDCVQDSFFPAYCNTKAFPDKWAMGTGCITPRLRYGWRHGGPAHPARPTHRVWMPPIKCLLKVPVVATFLINTQSQPAAKQPLAEALLFPSLMLHRSLSCRHPPSPGAAPQPSLSDSTGPLLHSWHLQQFPRH